MPQDMPKVPMIVIWFRGFSQHLVPCLLHARSKQCLKGAHLYNVLAEEGVGFAKHFSMFDIVLQNPNSA